MIEFEKVTEIISNNKSFLITTHINPDGDAIGSELALLRFLRNSGKSAEIINHSATPGNMKFMDTDNSIHIYDKTVNDTDIAKFDAIFVLDLNQLSRTGDLEVIIRNSGKPIICIDHHQNPDSFTEFLFVDASYGSTGEMIFDLVVSGSETMLTLEIGLPLYVAIVTDTGSFKYERTKPETHRKAARLLELGIDPKQVHTQIYSQGKLNAVKLLARALNSIELSSSGSIAVMKIMRKDFEETGTIESDTELFVNYTLSLRDVKIGMFMYEMEKGVKVSFRSVGNIPVNKLAAEFGGGGHINAAATRIKEGKLEEVKESILEAAQKYLN